MILTLLAHLGLLLACLALAGFFSGIETGVISIHRMRLRHFVKQGNPQARKLEAYLDQSDRLLGTTLVGTNLSLIVLSVSSASLAAALFGPFGQALTTGGVSLVAIVFAEYLPKAWFQSRPLERSLRFVGLLQVSEFLLKPFASAVIGITRLLLRGPSKTLMKPTPFVTREDLKLLAGEGEQSGILSARERLMIYRVIELAGRKARDLMVPRSEMAYASTDTPIPEAFATLRTRGFTRLPVFDRERNHFVGVINLFHILSSGKAATAGSLMEFSRPPLFIKEDMPVDEIFPLQRRMRQPMCLVTNAQGEVTGLITTENIIQAIVGKLQ